LFKLSFFPPLGGRKRNASLEAITMCLANAEHHIINRTICILGAAESGWRTNYATDGFVLANAIVESLNHGHSKGIVSTNPLTGKPCVIRVHVVGIRCDGPMVRAGEDFLRYRGIIYSSPLLSSQRNKIANLKSGKSRLGCPYCLYARPSASSDDDDDDDDDDGDGDNNLGSDTNDASGDSAAPATQVAERRQGRGRGGKRQTNYAPASAAPSRASKRRKPAQPSYRERLETNNAQEKRQRRQMQNARLALSDEQARNAVKEYTEQWEDCSTHIAAAEALVARYAPALTVSYATEDYFGDRHQPRTWEFYQVGTYSGVA
jgi:hypothetical protein